MSGYTNVFSGAQVVLPSARSYSLLTMTTTTTLVWPAEAASDTDQLTAILSVTATAGLQLRLPPGNEASPGSAAIISNVGANSVDLRVNTGASSIATIAAGTSLYVWLTDNSTANGTWQSVTLGAGSVAPSLSSQAGAGLVYFNGLLNAGYPSENISDPTYTLTEGDRATALVNTGGALTVSLADATTAFESNFFCLVRNDGSGAMVLDPSGSQTIDGQSTITLNQGQSCFVVLDGGTDSWRTIGRQTTNSTALTSGIIDVAGTGDYVLSSTEVALGIQQFDGILTGNRTITYGALTGVWYVFNNTSGAFTLTFRVDGSDAGVAVAQGDHAIIVLNGTNAVLAFTSSGGGGGTVTSITFQSPLSGGTITGSGTVGLANSGVSGGTYGGTAGWPVIVVSTKGIISDASTIASTSLSLPYLPTTGGTGTGNYGLIGAVTVNSLSGTSGTFSGAVSAASVTASSYAGTSANLSGAGTFGSLTATSGAFSGGLSGASVTATTGTFSGALNAASFTGTTANLSGTATIGVANITTGNVGTLAGTNADFSGSVAGSSFVGTTANISGTGAFGVVSGTSAVFSSTGLAVNATAGTGSFGTVVVNGTAISGAPSGTVAAATQVTFPIGTQALQLKAGVGTTNAGGTGTVAFGSAFPTAIISARVQPLFTGTVNDNSFAITNVYGTGTAGFLVGMFNRDGAAPTTTSFYYEAWGR